MGTLLLGILPHNTEKLQHGLFKYMLMAARVVLVTEWKAEECPMSENRKDEIAEYTTMAKLTNCISKRPFEEFEKKLKTY